MSAFRYVWDAVRTEIVDAGGNEWLACPHQRWRYDEDPPNCHECMEHGLIRLVNEGARDDEILPAFAHLPVPERRWMETTLDRLRTGQDPDRPNEWQARKIAEMVKIYPAMQRSARAGRVTKSSMATRIGIRRETISAWVDRGWMVWPPEDRNAQT